MRHARPTPSHPLLLTVLLAGLAFGQLPARALPAPQDPAPMALREQAFGAENRGDFAAAAKAFLELVELDPDNATWVVSAGSCLGRCGRYSDAIDLLEGARERFSGALEVTAMLSRTLLLKAERDSGALDPRGLRAQAAELAEEVLRAQPDHEDCRLILAQARYLLGEWDEAEKQAEEAARRHPHRPGAHILRGRIATDRFDQLLALHERGGLEGQALADLVAAIDRARKTAKASYARAAELDPSRAHPHVMLARVALLDHKAEEVRAHLLDALAIDPTTPVDHGPITAGLDWQRQRELYAATLERYAARPDVTAAGRGTLRWYEARALYEGAQWQEARVAFARALAENPAAINSHYYLALCAFELGDHDAAVRHAGDYAALSAKDFAGIVRNLSGEQRGRVAAIVRYLGHRAHQQGDPARSRDLNHVTALLFDTAAAWNNHAFLCRETGRYADALASYQRALEKEPRSPQLLNDTGVVLHYHLPNEQNLARAKALYEQAVESAAAILADPAASAAQKEQARQSHEDAQKNLAAMK